MKLTILSTSMAFAVVYGQGSIEEWAPGGADDARGPCPMMNTLANHGYLPHDGRNLTKENVVHALNFGLNFDTTLAGIMWDQAIIANPEPNATFFTLEQLNVHGVLEHDASMSRQDAHFGNNHVFNQTMFDTTTAFWPNDIITTQDIANGKVFRQVVSRSTNPEYSFSASVENFSLGEMAAPMLVFGNITTGEVRKDMIVSFFQNEKLPTDLGFAPQAEPITLDKVMFMSGSIANATSLITAASTTTTTTRRARRGPRMVLVGDLHTGGF